MAIGAVLYLVVVSTVIAFTLYYTLLSDYGAFEASLIAYLVPVVSTIVGVWFLDETIRVLTFVGFGLVFVGFALLKRRVLARYGEFFTL
jgi:drug/metabolite transporter (DMT)-like permease